MASANQIVKPRSFFAEMQSIRPVLLRRNVRHDPTLIENDVWLGFVKVLDADRLINRDLVAFFGFVDKDELGCRLLIC